MEDKEIALQWLYERLHKSGFKSFWVDESGEIELYRIGVREIITDILTIDKVTSALFFPMEDLRFGIEYNLESLSGRTDWTKVEQNTLIYVSDDNISWRRARFYDYEIDWETGKVSRILTYPNGQDMFTVMNNIMWQAEKWKYARLERVVKD